MAEDAVRSALPPPRWARRGSALLSGAAGVGDLLAGAAPLAALVAVAAPLAGLLAAVAPLAAQVPMWRVDTAAVTFEIHNAGLPVDGSFGHVEARVCFDPTRPEASSLSGTIDPGSIHTGIAMRDRHLHRRGWFEIARFETIEMRSVQLRRTSAGYAGTFALRIRDVQREVEVPFTFERSDGVARLTGELTIDRLDYGLGKPSLVLSDDVTIRVELSLVPETPTDTGRAGGNCTKAATGDADQVVRWSSTVPLSATILSPRRGWGGGLANPSADA